MKRIVFTTSILFLCFFSLQSQHYEAGISIGGTKYIGDIGNEYYFVPNQFGFGGFFKINHNPWFSYRVGLALIPVKADDFKSLSSGRKSRGFSFSGSVRELSLGIEYNFLKNNIYKRRRGDRIIPYMFSGITGINHGGQLTKNNVVILKSNNFSIGIPMALGIKFYLSNNFLITVEGGARFNFTDNLDRTYDYTQLHRSQKYFSKVNSNWQHPDWYTFSSISLVYTFGDLDCYFGL